MPITSAMTKTERRPRRVIVVTEKMVVVAAVTEETVVTAAGRRQAVPTAAAVKQTEGPAEEGPRTGPDASREPAPREDRCSH
jgi:hypothetical protein